MYAFLLNVFIILVPHDISNGEREERGCKRNSLFAKFHQKCFVAFCYLNLHLEWFVSFIFKIEVINIYPILCWWCFHVYQADIMHLYSLQRYIGIGIIRDLLSVFVLKLIGKNWKNIFYFSPNIGIFVWENYKHNLTKK